MNGLYNDRIPALAVFMKQSRRMYNNEKVTENMKIGGDLYFEYVSSFFVQLHKSIHYWKINGKDIADATKLVMEFVQCLLILGTGGRAC